MAKKILKITVLTLVALFIFIHISWLNISSVRLTKWLTFQGNRFLPKGTTLIVKNAAPTFWGLGVNSIEIRQKSDNVELAKLNQVELSFGILDLLLFQEVLLKFKAYDGVGEGRLDLFPRPRLILKVENLSINHNPFLRKTNILKSNPILTFEGGIELDDFQQGDIDFQLQKTAVNGDSKTSGLMFSFPDIYLEKISGKIGLKGDRIKLEIDTKGDISHQLKGQVDVNWKRLRRSRLNLKLLANLKKGYKKKLDFLEPLLIPYTRSDGKISVKIEGAVSFPEIKKL